MPSRPILQACWKIVVPSSLVCSLRTMPSRRLPNSLARRRPFRNYLALCIRFGPAPRVAASSHSCLDRVEKRACRAVTA
jgi:hypothetical protein